MTQENIWKCLKSSKAPEYMKERLVSCHKEAQEILTKVEVPEIEEVGQETVPSEQANNDDDDQDANISKSPEDLACVQKLNSKAWTKKFTPCLSHENIWSCMKKKKVPEYMKATIVACHKEVKNLGDVTVG